jgi:ABC-type polysaccharide/polyol phosphate export permease
MMEADYSRWHLLLFILLFVLVVGVMVSVPLITCAIAPEYVGIEALLSLLQS